MDLRLSTKKAKEWLEKDPSQVIFEMNALSGNKMTKPDVILDMVKLSNFFIDTNIAKKANKTTVTGVPHLILMDDCHEDSELTENKVIEPDSFEFDEWLCKKYLQTKTRANDKGLDFNLSLNDMRLIMRSKKCAYSEIKFDIDIHKLSLDRVDNSKGYIKGNVVACSEYVNHLKSTIMECDRAKDAMSNKNLKAMLISLSKLL